jgi:hypothetical protein
MAWTKTNDREEAYRTAINLWLKSNPENVAICKAVIEQNKTRRETADNIYGASKTNPKDFRMGLSLPPGLYYVLLKLERFHGREFMKDKKDLWWFAHKFPQFTICERI